VARPGRCRRGKEKGRCPHGPGGSRQLGWPGEAAWATVAFSLEANKNLKYLAISFGFHFNGFRLTSNDF
jgi:hypothetical protein